MTFQMNTIQNFGTTADAAGCMKQIAARVEGASLFAPSFTAHVATAPALSSGANA
ncbi:MAG: hypothetical protein PW788_00430 [Micavibrio sp.]|nr:hypothetical protein [Micavibrio sp.]